MVLSSSSFPTSKGQWPQGCSHNEDKGDEDNKVDEVASQLISQGKNSGLSDDKLQMLQKKINQMQINNSEKRSWEKFFF